MISVNVEIRIKNILRKEMEKSYESKRSEFEKGKDKNSDGADGFLMAAIGFALIDLFNRSDRFSIKMSPYFVAFFAFCFSMTVGVLWEFFEFSMDWLFGLDMQKDWILPSINSVKLNPTGANVPVHVDIQSVVINGEKWNLGGYLDIGIVDTMKDLMVNFIGAVVFSIIGILYLKHRGKGKLAASLIPQVRDEKEQKR